MNWNDPTDVCLSQDFISGYLNRYKIVHCLLQKTHRPLFKKITYLTLITRPSF